MGLKFNGGYGAYLCDGCGTMMREGGNKQFNHWERWYVETTIVVAISGDVTPEFCGVKCIERCANNPREDAVIRNACKKWLTNFRSRFS